jgi:putative membrane protein
MMQYFTHGWGMGFGWIVPIAIIALLFYLFSDRQRLRSSSAQEILDKRFANGEIDEAEYKEKSRLLQEQE